MKLYGYTALFVTIVTVGLHFFGETPFDPARYIIAMYVAIAGVIVGQVLHAFHKISELNDAINNNNRQGFRYTAERLLVQREFLAERIKGLVVYALPSMSIVAVVSMVLLALVKWGVV